MQRRTLLKSAALGLAAAGLPRGLFAQDLTPLRVQLGWISNVEYVDHWLALENGYFTEEGLDVTVMPGGPNAPDPLTMVAAGSAEIGYTSWLPFLDAVGKGNDFVIIAARMQTSPLGIISLAAAPILEPKDIVGKKILAQGPAEQTSIEATLSLNGLPNDWEMVTAGFSPEPLVAGDGQGYTAFATNQTITLEQMGLVRDKDFFFRSFDELGFPGYAGIAFVSRAYLEANRDALVKYTAAIIKGFKADEADPALGAKITVEKYGADFGLDVDQQTRQNELQIGFMRPGGDPDFPLYALDPAKMEGPMYDAARATGRTDLPPIGDIIDTSIVADALKLA
ncbi:ABC transporter substrate-binding protein [Devosia neptuniae]|uniref:Thiamine pyrimidine synthase n=1 Tax=Devosia neptuniae TaxID=191302 RepID=A0ABY6CGD9_9HYPH|nr:ABC transporter substrate-binding protein [Devosia neptuniae]UXN69118.1 ABC transporter substrate-binding protein [Devosia neptuniae]